MDMKVVELGQFSPNCCTLCKTSDGPFVDVKVNYLDVPTATGKIRVNGRVYICVGREGHPGCAAHLGVLAGCLSPLEAEGLRTHVTSHSEAVERLEAQVQQLETDLAEERAKPALVDAAKVKEEILSAVREDS